jgi:FAD/FMN-containing dehydrogenase
VFRGELIRAGDPLYEAARRVWNGAIDRRPVRGGGHNVAGTATCDGGVVIDLSPMKGLWVDPVTRTARAAGTALGRGRP